MFFPHCFFPSENIIFYDKNSENFDKYIAERVPVIKKLVELIVNITGSIINPSNMPKYLKTKFVTKNCIINVARPVNI